MLLAIDGTLVVQLVNFVIFLLVLNAIFIKPVSAAIVSRRAYINQVGTDIEQFEADVRALHAQAIETVAAARRAADALILAQRIEAQSDAADIVADHQEQGNALIEQAQATVAIETVQARNNESQIVERLAHEMLLQAVGSEVAA